MLLPVALSFLAALSAAFMAYGTDPRWAAHDWGLGLIMTARRLQWPLIALSLLLCIALLALVISGKRRVWWLIGLAPVLALFGHRFVTGPVSRYDVADAPAFVSAEQATFVNEEDHVVGIVFSDRAYAYPYACLFETPVIIQSDRDQRMLLMWSPHANTATALAVGLELKARDLDIASEPGDGLLVYNRRRGEFIAAVTGRTPRGAVPTSAKRRLEVTKTTWREWKARQPETHVMLPRDGSYDGATKPLVRGFDEPLVILVNSPAPVALLPEQVTGTPVNATAGSMPVLVFRDAASGRVRAFDRHVESDLTPQFRRNTSARRKGALFVDLDTDSGWTSEGVAIDGPAKGKKLAPVDVQEDVGWHAAKYWYPGLTIVQPSADTPAGLRG